MHVCEPNGLDATFQQDIHENLVPAGAKINPVLILGLGRGVVAINFLTKGRFRRQCVDSRPILNSFSITRN
jgi:hypothetical protein